MKKEDFDNYENSSIKKVDDKLNKILDILHIDNSVKSDVFESLYKSYETPKDYETIIEKIKEVIYN